MCPLCKNSHLQLQGEHNIIEYDKKNNRLNTEGKDIENSKVPKRLIRINRLWKSQS